MDKSKLLLAQKKILNKEHGIQIRITPWLLYYNQQYKDYDYYWIRMKRKSVSQKQQHGENEMCFIR